MIRDAQYFEDAVFRFESLILFRNLQKDPVLTGLAQISRALAGDKNSRSAVALYYEWLAALLVVAEEKGYAGNVFACHMIDQFLNDENPFTIACEHGHGLKDATLRELAKKDAETLQFFIGFDVQNIADNVGRGERVITYQPVSVQDLTMLEQVSSCKTAEDILRHLEWYYAHVGAGDLGIYKMFRLDHSDGVRVYGVKRPDPVSFSDIIGYSAQKAMLCANAEAFLGGAAANNMLLCGPSGTGKSSCVKALANQYFDKGLRLIKVDSSEISDIQKIMKHLSNRSKRFIVFIDDLSFEAPDDNYLCMKSMLEGDVETCPKNVLFCATSNRRHMMKELWSDRKDNADTSDSDEVHVTDTVSEKLSLSDRFGLTVYFPKPSPKEYQDIMLGIAKKENIRVSEDFLREQSMKWEIANNGLSGRTARQFINNVIGETRKV